MQCNPPIPAWPNFYLSCPPLSGVSVLDLPAVFSSILYCVAGIFPIVGIRACVSVGQ
ncbi:hypothetical protein BDV10DRAFT_166087 [Aspergillus recurvatus]